uniref:Otopetrin-2-like isoform X9 n=1 Tax=Hirondellea gigas TaxID=1518452 RepID=A0A6A7FUC1_9CRUS
MQKAASGDEGDDELTSLESGTLQERHRTIAENSKRLPAAGDLPQQHGLLEHKPASSDRQHQQQHAGHRPTAGEQQQATLPMDGKGQDAVRVSEGGGEAAEQNEGSLYYYKPASRHSGVAVAGGVRVLPPFSPQHYTQQPAKPQRPLLYEQRQHIVQDQSKISQPLAEESYKNKGSPIAKVKVTSYVQPKFYTPSSSVAPHPSAPTREEIYCEPEERYDLRAQPVGEESPYKIRDVPAWSRQDSSSPSLSGILKRTAAQQKTDEIKVHNSPKIKFENKDSVNKEQSDKCFDISAKPPIPGKSSTSSSSNNSPHAVKSKPDISTSDVFSIGPDSRSNLFSGHQQPRGASSFGGNQSHFGGSNKSQFGTPPTVSNPVNKKSVVIRPKDPNHCRRGAERDSGALVWISQPGGGAKLDWVPTPNLSTLRSLPNTPGARITRQGSDAGVEHRPPDRGGGRASVERMPTSVNTAAIPTPASTCSPPILKHTQSSDSKNVHRSAPGNARPEGRSNTGEADDCVVAVPGRATGQIVRIRVRPEVHAYLAGLPVTSSPGLGGERRDSIPSVHSTHSSSASALTGCSESGGEGSAGYHEQDYSSVVDEYALLQRAVVDHDAEALRLLSAAEAAVDSRHKFFMTAEGREYPYLREMRERLLTGDEQPPLAVMDEQQQQQQQHCHPEARLLQCHPSHTPVGTVVKLNADGYGSHTSPTRRMESCYTSTLERRHHASAYGMHPKNAKTSSFITLSMLYATLLVVVCLGFLLSEVLTHNVPLYYYEAFFTYLYAGSILFLLYVFCYLLTGSGGGPAPKPKNSQKRKGEEVPGDETSPTTEKLTGTTTPPKPRKTKISDNEHSHGSFFLRVGVIAFGLGTMIYNGLEFGVFLEIPLDSPCHMILRGVNPIAQLVFTFMQMYFIFMNARLNIHKFKCVARFGLMHMVATNVCVWIRTLIRESLKEINEFKVSQGHTGEDYMIMEGIRRALEKNGLLAPNRYLYNLDEFVEMQDINDTMVEARQRLTQQDIMNRSCGRVEIMGSIVADSAPYLYPFIIEYSLIGACVLFIMWKHIGRSPKYVYDSELGDGISVASRRCQVKVDCIGASKGLFCGLLVLVSTLICLILFFVLIHQENLRRLAIYLADVSHCTIMLLSIIAIFIGFCRVRQLSFHGEREEELDDILLMVSAFGLFAYAIFSAVAGSLSAYTEEPNLLVLVTSILSILQVIIQVVFIKDTQRRQVRLPEHERTKPGRQVITFLLICNLTMWVVYTFETQKVEANPVQLEFFGQLAWTILLRCTIPLAIFHRFHCTVVLAAIWKNSYKSRIE